MLKLVKASFLALAGLGMASVYGADAKFDAFMQTVSGNKTTVTFGTGGTPVLTSSAPLGTPSVGNMGFEASDGDVYIRSKGQARLPTGGTVPIETKLKLTRNALAKGLAKATLFYTAWETGSQLYDIWTQFDLEFQNGQVVQPGATGGSTVPKITTGHLHTCVSGSTGPRGGAFSCSDLGFSSFEASTQYQSAAQSAWLAKIAGVGQAICNAYAQRDNANYSYTYEGGTYSAYQGSWYGYVPCKLDGYTAVDQIGFVFQYSPPASTCPANSTDNGTSCTCAPNYAADSGLCLPSFQSLTQQELEQRVSDLLASEGWPTSDARAAADALRIPQVQAEVLPLIEAQPQTDTQVQVQGIPQGTPFQVGDPVTTTTTQTNPDGTTSEKVQTTTTTATATGNTIQTQRQTQTTTTTRDAAGVITGTTTATTTTAQTATTPATENEDLECGLPGGPPCKIDEEGTPDPPDPDEEGWRSIFAPIQDCAEDLEACLPELPEINLTFAFPSSCGAIPTPAFAPFISSIDICQYQGMFHDLMSMIWAAVGVFGAISIVSRNPFS